MVFVKGGVSAPKRDAMDLFMSRVVKQDDGCWIWTGPLDKGGYAKFFVREADGKTHGYLAHRWLYKRLIGPITEATLDHRCRVRRCVNPLHLEPVTQRTNILRGEGLAAKNAEKTRCPHGHEYSDENTYRTPSGGRQCRICERARCRRYYHDHKKEET